MAGLMDRHAHIRDDHVDPWTGYHYRRWHVDPVLAIGGCKHGETLPLHDGWNRDLMVPKPPDLSAFLASPEVPEVTAMDDMAERYHWHEFQVPRRDRVTVDVFPVYVAASMPLDEAEVWLKLVLTWFWCWHAVAL